jgi:acetolactate synthase regulatory subunit
VRHHLALELSDSASSLIRVVSCVHSRGLRVEHLHLRGTVGCMSVVGKVELHRVVTTLDRLVDVLVVESSPSCSPQASADQALRVVVAKQLSPEPC